MRLTRALSSECPQCKGLGYTKQCEATMNHKNIAPRGEEPDWVEVSTVRNTEGRALVGSGCLMCLGLGQI